MNHYYWLVDFVGGCSPGLMSFLLLPSSCCFSNNNTFLYLLL